MSGLMTLGGYTLPTNPSSMTLLQPDKTCAEVLTWGGVAFFSWGCSIIGKNITIGWKRMPAQEFDALDALFQADAALPWFTGIFNDGAVTYTVEITKLTGDYYTIISDRIDVKMTLLIIGIV